MFMYFNVDGRSLELELDEQANAEIINQLLGDCNYVKNYIETLIDQNLCSFPRPIQEIIRLEGNEQIMVYQASSAFNSSVCDDSLMDPIDACDNSGQFQTNPNLDPQASGTEVDKPDGDTLKPDYWSDEHTKFMLDQYERYLREVGPLKKFKTKKRMWERIAADLQFDCGISKTALQVENRYKTVLKRKKKSVENNSRSGQSRVEVPFEEELGKIAQIDDSIEPEVLRDSNQVKYLKRPNCPDENDKKKKKKFSLSEQLSLMHKEREEAKEKRHKEKLLLIEKLFGKTDKEN